MTLGGDIPTMYAVMLSADGGRTFRLHRNRRLYETPGIARSMIARQFAPVGIGRVVSVELSLCPVVGITDYQEQLEHAERMMLGWATEFERLSKLKGGTIGEAQGPLFARSR